MAESASDPQWRCCRGGENQLAQAPPVRLPKRSFLPNCPGVELQAQIQGERLGEPRPAALGGAGQAEEQFSQLLRFWQGAVGVQPQPDLRFLQLAQIAVGGIQSVVFSRSPPQGGREVELRQPALQLNPQGGGALRTELAGFPVLIEQGFEGLKVPMQASPAQGRREVVEDHGLAAALGLAALSWIVHDEGIEVGHGAEGPFRETLLREAHGLAWQPLQVAVLAHMHHGLAVEVAAQPEVLGQVGVGGRKVGAVIGQLRVSVVAAIGLHQQGHTPKIEAPDGEALTTIGHALQAPIPLRRAPHGLKPIPALNGQAAVPVEIGRQGQMGERRPVAALGVVGAAGQQKLDQSIAIRWQGPLHAVARLR